MRYRVLNSEVKNLIDNRSTGVRQTVIIQVKTAGNVWISTQLNGSDLQQLDSTGAPVNGLKLSQANSPADGKFEDFQGVLFARSDVGVDVDVTVHNSPPQMYNPPKPTRGIPSWAPRWGNT